MMMTMVRQSVLFFFFFVDYGACNNIHSQSLFSISVFVSEHCVRFDHSSCLIFLVRDGNG